MIEKENLEKKPAPEEKEGQESKENLSKADEEKIEKSTPAETAESESASSETSESVPAEVKPEEKPKEQIAEIKAEEKKEEQKEKAEEEGIQEKPPESKWYVIQALSGKEEKVKEAIEKNIQRLGMDNKIFEVLIPEEEVIEIKGAKRIERKKKMFPGYVFLNMMLDDESWYAIRQTPGVARFIGTKIKPTPVSGREMQRVLKQLGVKEEKLEIEFKKGQTVRVISGPFRGYTGTVDEINKDKEKLKVLINIFGRDTPVEVNFEHAEKIV